MDFNPNGAADETVLHPQPRTWHTLKHCWFMRRQSTIRYVGSCSAPNLICSVPCGSGILPAIIIISCVCLLGSIQLSAAARPDEIPGSSHFRGDSLPCRTQGNVSSLRQVRPATENFHYDRQPME